MSKDIKDIFIHLFRIILKALTEALLTVIKVMLISFNSQDKGIYNHGNNIRRLLIKSMSLGF